MVVYSKLRKILVILVIALFILPEAAISSGTQVDILFSPAGVFIKTYSAAGLNKSKLPDKWQQLLEKAEVTEIKNEGSRVYAIWFDKGASFAGFTRAVWFDKEQQIGKVRLINAMHPLKLALVPSNLTTVDIETLACAKHGMMLDRDAFQALQNMANAAKKDGVTLTLNSAYRSGAYQNRLFEQEFDSSGDTVEEVAMRVAKPGTSEHQSGLAADMNADNWLIENCWRFGYILRYAETKTQFTNIVPEPWHYRYVGQPHALIMRDHNWCLEEYLEKLVDSTFIVYQEPISSYCIYYIGNWASRVGMTDDSQNIDISYDGKNGYIVTCKRKSF